MSTIGQVLFAFFEDHLKAQKGLRPGSVRSYRDTLKLFLVYVATACRRPQNAANSASNASVSGPSNKLPVAMTRAIASLTSGCRVAKRRETSTTGSAVWCSLALSKPARA